jgi:RimJ/RimL family protein N-acetyltransferase
MSLCRGDHLRDPLEESVGYEVPESAEFIAETGPEGIRSIAGFANWRGYDVEVYLTTTGSISRAFLRRIAHYAFSELRVKFVRCQAAADNVEWLDQIRRMGFVEEGRQRGGFDGTIDMACFSVTQEEFIL